MLPELLQSAQKLTSDPKMLESLKLQREAHLRQRLLVEHRKNLSQFISKCKCQHMYNIGQKPQQVSLSLRLFINV